MLNWTACQTYMEFFGAAALPDETLVGDCGIGLSVETKGGFAAVAERLRTVFGDRIEIDKQVRTTATRDIPWYASTHLKEPQATAMWAALHPETPVRNPLSREQDRSWDYHPEQTFDNVVGLTLALNPEKTSELAAQLRLFGWSVHRAETDLVAVGREVKIRVVPAGARAGIQQVDLRLHRSVPKQRIQLGSAELRLVGNSGRLIFWKSE